MVYLRTGFTVDVKIDDGRHESVLIVAILLLLISCPKLLNITSYRYIVEVLLSSFYIRENGFPKPKLKYNFSSTNIRENN